MGIIKKILYFGIFLIAVLYWHNINVEQEKSERLKLQQKLEAEQQYLNSPEGKDEVARKQSLDGKIIVSQTGKKYYRGILCSKDCSGLQAGYEWSTKLGVTYEDACENNNNSKSFKEGCLKGVEDTLQELRQYFKEQYPEDYICQEDYLIDDTDYSR